MSDTPTRGDIEKAFHSEMVAIYETAKRDLHYNATRFLQLVSTLGGVAAARQLLHTSQPSEGFTTLWDRGRLDLSVEAHVIDDRYAELFTDEERELARRRLEQYGWRD